MSSCRKAPQHVLTLTLACTSESWGVIIGFKGHLNSMESHRVQGSTEPDGVAPGSRGHLNLMGLHRVQGSDKSNGVALGSRSSELDVVAPGSRVTWTRWGCIWSADNGYNQQNLKQEKTSIIAEVQTMNIKFKTDHKQQNSMGAQSMNITKLEHHSHIVPELFLKTKITTLY